MINDLIKVRRSGRCIIDAPSFAHKLWPRVQPLLPKAHKAFGTTWEPVALNERMRFLQYHPGDYFRPHTDGSIALRTSAGQQQRSFYTLMIYLDAPTKGGSTRFLDPQLSGAPPSEVHPRPGLGLVFEHDLLHEGATLEEGVKHALRTDVMFRKKPGAPTQFASLEQMLGLKAAGKM